MPNKDHYYSLCDLARATGAPQDYAAFQRVYEYSRGFLVQSSKKLVQEAWFLTHAERLLRIEKLERLAELSFE
jgi:hypothetical protein